jgi:putative sigma-54 modulation protein
MIPIQIKCINVEIPQPEMLEIENGYHQAFDRFQRFIREAQVTLRDINGPKGGVDKLCTIQFRFYPRGLAVVRSSGTSFSQAANSAWDKMQQVAARRLGKRKKGPLKNSQIEYTGRREHGSQISH